MTVTVGQTGTFYVAADTHARDLRHPEITYQTGACAPADGGDGTALVRAYADLADAAAVAGPDGMVFEVAGCPVGVDDHGAAMLARVTVLGVITPAAV